MGSEIVGGTEDSQQTQPKTQNPIVRTGRPVKSEQPSGSLTQEIDKGVLFGCESTNVSTERPVNSGQSIGLFSQREEIDIDFRVSGLPQTVVKQAENFRVRELVKKIGSHPHREALQAREMGNVELFELCKPIPEVQCSQCLLYWNQGIVYCTCGYLLVESGSSQNFHQLRPDAFSIPHYVIRKVRLRGARHGKAEALNEHFVAHNARKRCITKNFDGIHDRFQRDSAHRDSQLNIGWTEEKCIEMDKLAQEDHSCCPSSEEYARF